MNLLDRVVAEALMRHSSTEWDLSYEEGIESPDSVAWLRADTASIVAAWPCTEDEMVALLVDSAWLDLEAEPSDERGRRVHRDICAEVGDTAWVIRGEG